jgi:hypothetical protein
VQISLWQRAEISKPARLPSILRVLFANRIQLQRQLLEKLRG